MTSVGEWSKPMVKRTIHWLGHRWAAFGRMGKKSWGTVLLIDSQTPVWVCPFDGKDKVKGGKDTDAEREQNRQTQKMIPLTPVNRDMKSQRWVWFGLEGWSNGELGRGWYRSWGKIKPHQRTKVRLSIGWTCGGGRQLKRGILFRQQPIGLSPRSFGKSLTSSFDRYNTCHALMWKKSQFSEEFQNIYYLLWVPLHLTA